MHRPKHSGTCLSPVPLSSKILGNHKPCNQPVVWPYWRGIQLGLHSECLVMSKKTHEPTIPLLNVLGEGMMQVVLIPHPMLVE